MPNTYAKFGQSIGDILGRAGGVRSSAPQGYSKGLDAGSQHMLRSAQTSKAMADTDKVLYELGLAKAANEVSAPQLAQAMGVDPGAYDALSVPGATTMPAIPGAAGPSPAVPIPQAMRDKFTNANTLKVLQQLTGGTTSGATADTLMNALLKGQELGTRSNLQAGAQDPVDVARAEAAIQGKFPGTAGGGKGGSVASKVQEVNHLIGLGIPKEKAILVVQGDPGMKMWAQVFQGVKDNFGSDAKAKKTADAALKNFQFNLGLKAPGAQPPGNVVKVYQ